jgi:hypothetical protein
MSYFGQFLGEYPGKWWGGVIAPPPPPPVEETSRGYAPRRRRAKQREFDDDRRTREMVRKLIRQIVDPSTESAQVVASSSNVVAVLPDAGRQVAVPVPPDFSAAEVATIVVEQLMAMGVEAERVRSAGAQARARALVDAFIAEQERRTRKRRREEEWLLLMN